MSERILVRGVVPATPAQVFAALLDSDQHAAMTGAGATVSPDGSFTAWDGYIHGRTVETHTDVRIVQTWRTTEFPEGAPDSRLEVTLEPHAEGTLVTFTHEEIPAGQGKGYQSGWEDYYLKPMRAYFRG